MTFEDAVAYAKAVRKRAEAIWLNPEMMGPLSDAALELACQWQWRGIPGQRSAMRQFLCDLAGRDPKAQEWLRLRIAKAIDGGEPIPPVFMSWAADFLRNPRPPNINKGPKGKSIRNEILAFTVRQLVKCGLQLSRNDATAPAYTAYDAVCIAWGINHEALRQALSPELKKGLRRKNKT